MEIKDRITACLSNTNQGQWLNSGNFIEIKDGCPKGTPLAYVFLPLACFEFDV